MHSALDPTRAQIGRARPFLQRRRLTMYVSGVIPEHWPKRGLGRLARREADRRGVLSELSDDDLAVIGVDASFTDALLASNEPQRQVVRA
jgi:hypothetical protein